MSDVEDAKLYLVVGDSRREEFYRWLITVDEPVAIDIEGDSLEAPHMNRVRSVQFGTRTVGWNLPTADYDPQVVRDNREAVYHALEVLWGQTKVLHNLAYDIPQLKYHFKLDDWDWENTHDTLLVAQIELVGEPAGLKHLNEKYIQAGSAYMATLLDRFMRKGRPCPREHVKGQGRCADCGGRRKIPYTWATVPVDAPEYWMYGAADTTLTARLYHHFNDKGWLDSTPYREKMDLAELCVDMSLVGLKVDRDYCEQQIVAVLERANELKQIAEIKWGVKNINSNAQLVPVFKTMNAELTEKTDKGAYKLDAKVLTTLANNEDTAELATLVLEYKGLHKDKGYFDRFLKYADEDGYIHAQVNPNAASTGRMSISKPSLQNLTAKNNRVRNAVIVG